MKTCTKCGIEKALAEFPKQKTGRLGRRADCKSCVAGYDKVRYEANPGSKKEYNEEHREDKKAYDKARREANPEYFKEHNKAWTEKNRERVNVKEHNRRARVAGLEGTWTIEEWKFLLDLCGYRCLKCKIHQDELDTAMTMDHIIPISIAGSTNWIGNIQPLCERCNKGKNNRDSIDYRPDIVRVLIEN